MFLHTKKGRVDNKDHSKVLKEQAAAVVSVKVLVFIVLFRNTRKDEVTLGSVALTRCLLRRRWTEATSRAPTGRNPRLSGNRYW